MPVRKYIPSDCEELIRLFYDTVHFVNAADYTREQLDAWAPETADMKRWTDSFVGRAAFVAVENGVIAGFGDIDGSGYLDRLFVHKDLQGQGIGSAICDALESAVDADKITVHASVTARPFFENRGYAVVKRQNVLCRGVFLMNYVMEKQKVEKR